MDDVGEASPAMGEGTDSHAAEKLSRYLVCVVEDEKAPGGDVEVGMVAVETSTGDVLFAQFMYALTLHCTFLDPLWLWKHPLGTCSLHNSCTP
jgi:hypothetical protein